MLDGRHVYRRGTGLKVVSTCSCFRMMVFLPPPPAFLPTSTPLLPGPGCLLKPSGEVCGHGEGKRPPTHAAGGQPAGHVQPHRAAVWGIQRLHPSSKELASDQRT